MSTKTYYQAFPLHEHTFNGIPSNEPNKKYTVLHAVADGTLTLTFNTGSTLVIDILEDEDYALVDGTTFITCTSTVLMS